MSNIPSGSPLPQPKSEHRIHKGMLWLAIILLCITAGGLWWATRDDPTREALRRQAEDELANAQKKAVAALREAVGAKQPSPLPEIRKKAVDTVITENGLPHDAQAISPEDLALMETLTPENAAQTTEEGVNKEDRIVRQTFVDNAAHWMAMCYHADTAGAGHLRCSPQWVNSHFAEHLQGIVLPEMDNLTQRSSLLHYLLRSDTLQSLYDRYKDSFMQAFDASLRQPADGITRSEGQVRDAYRQYSAYLTALAAGLESIAANPNLAGELQRIENAGEQAIALNSQITEAVFHMDAAREVGDQQAVREAQERINILTTQYRLAINEQDVVRQQVMNNLKQHGGRQLDNTTMLFMAKWVNRRLQQDKNAATAVRSAAQILRSLAALMQQKQ